LRWLGSTVYLSRKWPNHALELTAARTVFSFSMITSFPPHLTLAPWIPFQAPGFPSATPRTVFTKTEAPASLDALAVLDTSRRRVRSLRTADCDSLSLTHSRRITLPLVHQ
jgi:hypothetical protein